MMQIIKGQDVWIPCKTKKGPFSDEHRVYVDGNVFFVQDFDLKEIEGVGASAVSFVRARVLKIRDGELRVKVRGSALNSAICTVKISNVNTLGRW